MMQNKMIRAIKAICGLGQDFLMGVLAGGWFEFVFWLFASDRCDLDGEFSWRILLGPFRGGLTFGNFTLVDAFMITLMIVVFGVIVFAISWLPFRTVRWTRAYAFSVGVAWSIIGLFSNPIIVGR